MGKLEFTDRYQALGISYPDPKTVCEGQCEGTGWVPICYDEEDPQFRQLWIEAENKRRKQIPKGRFGALRRLITGMDNFDGWHFVKCPDCKGTGKK